MPLSRLILPIVLSVSLLIVMLANQWQFVTDLDNHWLDWVTQQRAKTHKAPDDIVLIDIDEHSIFALADQLGNWPWPRAAHAELVDWLQAQGVHQIAFDIWFSEPDVHNPESDAYLGDVVNRYPNIFLPTMQIPVSDQRAAPRLQDYPASFLITPLRPDAHAQQRALLFKPVIGDVDRWKIGSINFLADNDGLGRRYEIFRVMGDWQMPSLPTRMLMDDGQTFVERSTVVLDWYGPFEQPFTHYSYSDLFQKMQNGQTLDLKNKVVFIGSTAAGIHDFKPTAIAAQYPGLYMLATAYSNLRFNEQLQRLSLRYAAPIVLLSLLLMYLLLNKRWQSSLALWQAACLFVFCIFITHAASYYCGLRSQLLPVTSMSLLASVIFISAAALRYRDERRSRQQAIRLFSRFLDENIVKSLANDGLTPQNLTPQSVELSILFSDIRGFTTLSENKAPSEIMQLLNAYFSKQVAVIFKNQGTLDKFIGDAIMAFWGAPLPDKQHAIHAVSAALDMCDALEQFKQDYQLDEFDIGIGIHSGPAVVGMLGSEQRLEYTAIGDTINLGSRLEGLTKGHARILISQQTRDACGEHFYYRYVGEFQVKGRQEAVCAYEPSRR